MKLLAGNRQGGVLLDLFVIVLIVGGGVWAWGRQDQWKPWLRSVWSGEGRTSVGASALTEDATPSSARLQSQIRDLLSRRGIVEKDLVKATTLSREEKGVRWVEATLEIKTPRQFHAGHFLEDLLPVLVENKWAVMRDERLRGKWILELGDREKVFQRLVFLPAGRI